MRNQASNTDSLLHRKRILEEPIPGLVAKMAVPTVIMNLISLIYNTVDTYYISQIDKSAAAAVGAVFSIMSVVQAIAFGFGMGVSSLCSRKVGEGSFDEANEYCSSGFAGSMLVSALVGIVGALFLDTTLKIIGCTDTMLPYARPYAFVILLSAPLLCGNSVINNILKAEGHTKLSMIGLGAGSFLNSILDPIFIFKLDMGCKGAAIATAISNFVSLSILLSHFIRKKTVLKLSAGFISKDLKKYFLIISTGLPTVFRQGLGAVATALLCNRAKIYGDAAVAAVTIANKCYMIVRNIVLGIGQGAQPVCGINYGAAQKLRARQSYDFATKIGTVFCVAAAIVMAAFAPDILWWFCKDEEVVKYGVTTLYAACLVMPLMAFSTYVNQQYQVLGFRLHASILASCRQGICFVPAIILLPMLMGLFGVQISQPFADLMTFIIAVPYYVNLRRTLS